MASNKLIAFLVILVTILLHGNNNTIVEAQLRADFYDNICPGLDSTVFYTLMPVVTINKKLPAYVLRLFYLDCFVNGCDGSVLLANTPSITGEQHEALNGNSFRQFKLFIDSIKVLCPQVSCADLLALTARASMELHDGPRWELRFGRRDTRNASEAADNSSLPGPRSSLSELISSFAKVGLSPRDLVALSGAHSMGKARCKNFRERIYNDTNIDPVFAARLQRICPRTYGDEKTAPLGYVSSSPLDNQYFRRLTHQRGLLHSDQELFNNGSTDSIVREYLRDYPPFYRDFAAAMTRMSEINPLTGTEGEIRKNCFRIN